MKTNYLTLAYIALIFLIAVSCEKETLQNPITGVNLSQTSLLIEVGSKDTLNAKISPSNTTKPDVIWISSDATIATVSSNGIVTGVAPGVAIITVTTVEGNYTASCTVNTIKWTTYNTNNSGLKDNIVEWIGIDSQDNLWLGGSSVTKFDGLNWFTYMANKGIGSIAIDEKGNKWIGTQGGVTKFDGTNWTNYTSNDHPVLGIKSIAINSQGDKWFGTANGVIKLQD